jgi:hypothetical protein
LAANRESVVDNGGSDGAASAGVVAVGAGADGLGGTGRGFDFRGLTRGLGGNVSHKFGSAEPGAHFVWVIVGRDLGGGFTGTDVVCTTVVVGTVPVLVDCARAPFVGDVAVSVVLRTVVVWTVVVWTATVTVTRRLAAQAAPGNANATATAVAPIVDFTLVARVHEDDRGESQRCARRL